jgi:hypothetical protein
VSISSLAIPAMAASSAVIEAMYSAALAASVPFCNLSERAGVPRTASAGMVISELRDVRDRVWEDKDLVAVISAPTVEFELTKLRCLLAKVVYKSDEEVNQSH